MKKTIFALLLFAFCASAFADDTYVITYYGTRTGWFRACKGETTRACKIIVTVKPSKFLEAENNVYYIQADELTTLEIDDFSADDTSSCTVLYDGSSYAVSPNQVNFQTGEIIQTAGE